MDAYEKAGINVIAVSTDPPVNLVDASIQSKSNFPMFQDPDGDLLTALDLLHEKGNPINGADLARPAHVLFNKEGDVLWLKATDNYRVRPTPAEVLETIKDIR